MYKKQITKAKPFIISFIICALGIYIILYNLKDNIVFFYSPSEVLQKNLSSSQIIRVGGLVKTNSVVKNNSLTEFIITDNNNDLKIRTEVTLPPIFREGQGVVAQGYFHDDLFFATEVLAKHDEKYAPKEIIQSLKVPDLRKEK